MSRVIDVRVPGGETEFVELTWLEEEIFDQLRYVYYCLQGDRIAHNHTLPMHMIDCQDFKILLGLTFVLKRELAGLGPASDGLSPAVKRELSYSIVHEARAQGEHRALAEVSQEEVSI